jgi:hypothetical protein
MKPLVKNSLILMSNCFVFVSGINGNQLRPHSLIGSKVGAYEAKQSSLIFIYTAHANKRETCGNVGREWGLGKELSDFDI